MASRGNLEATLKNFRELNRRALGRSKIILSCRTHYFHSHRHVERFLGYSAPTDYTDLYREIASRPNFSITYLQEFDNEHINQYLERRCGEEITEIRQFIDETYNLRELSKRPVLLDMIVKSSNQLRSSREDVTPGVLYLNYTDLWLSYNDWQLTIDVDTKTKLLEHIAAKLIYEVDPSIKFEYIPPLIISWQESITPVDAAVIDRELRTATFLERNGEGYYKFSHKSFLEFFYARFLLSSSENGHFLSWDNQHFTREVYRFVRDLVVLSSSKKKVENLLAWLGDETKSEWVRTNAIKCVAIIKSKQVAEALLNIVNNNLETIKVRRVATTALGNQTGQKVFLTLTQLAESKDENLSIRSNALLAIGRLNSKESTDYLGNLLKSKTYEGRLRGRQVRSIFMAVSEIGSKEILNECIEYTKRHVEEQPVVRLCLELIKGYHSAASEDLCREVVLNSNSSKDVALAVQGLSIRQRRELCARIIHLIDFYKKDQYVSVLVQSLEGICNESIEEFLKEKILNERRKYALEAIRILAKDYPDCIEEMLPNLLYGQSHEFRFEVARSYYQIKGKEALPLFERMLKEGKKISLKIKLVTFLAKNEPDALVKIVCNNRALLEVPRLANVALQEVLSVNENTAVKVVNRFCIDSKRVGIRVMACAILGAVNSSETSGTLLDLLERDNSRWVRLQALRSLLTPGYSLGLDAIYNATKNEPDTEVLKVRDDLILAR